MAHLPPRHLLLDDQLIGEIVKKYPGAPEIVRKYFGEDCLQRASFKIKTLKTACILFGVDRNRLIQEMGDDETKSE